MDTSLLVEIPMEGVLFLLSGIAIIHFDDMQKTHPFVNGK